MDPTPEQLLGMPVLERGGRQIGVVEDVGLATWRQPKFLLVRPLPIAAGPLPSLVRVDFGQVEAVGEEGVRVAVPLNRAPPAFA